MMSKLKNVQRSWKHLRRASKIDAKLISGGSHVMIRVNLPKCYVLSLHFGMDGLSNTET